MKTFSAPKENSVEDFSATQDEEALKKEVVEKLRSAANAQKRVETFAKLLDTYGLDPILGLIPELGDAGGSGLAGIYLLFEAKNAGLDKTAYLKIIGLQAADFFIGVIPILGDAADYFFKANRWSAEYFQKKTAELAKKAAQAGVDPKEVAKITETAEKLPRLVEKAVGVYAHAKGKA